jgi:transcription elongation factor/antiterminator RfaH
MSSSVAAGVRLGADRPFRHVRSPQGMSVLPPTDCPRLRSTQPDAGRACWYAVYTRPRRELRAQVQLSIQGFPTFLPRFRKTVRHARKLVTVSAPFFDRYLFVALDLDRDRWRSVNGTFGVTGLVANRTGPIPLPPGVIEAMIDASDAHGFVNVGRALRVGECVRVLTGPFADLVGVLVRADGARRVQVLLQLLGGTVAVSIDRGHLAAARAA